MKKRITIIACLLMIFVMNSINVSAEEYMEHSLPGMTVSIPADWNRKTGENYESFYYPDDCYDSNGNVCALVIIDDTFSTSINGEEEQALDDFVEGMGIGDGVSVESDELVDVNGVESRKVTCSQIINGNEYETITHVMISNNYFVSIGLCQLKGFEKNFEDEYNCILKSLKKEKEFTKYEYGMNKVGTDIPAGEYIIYAKNGRGYFCVSSDSNQEDIIFNENFDYNSIISINDGEYLKMSHCYAIPISENPDVLTEGTGMFKVGLHIPAGEYKLEATDDRGYYCIYPDSRQDDIIANDIFEGQTYVTVADGQYLVLSGCKFVDPPEKPIVTYTDADTVKRVQEALNAAGYDCGTPDGSAGNMTVGQIQKYQTDKGLNVTGTITDELLESLGI